MRKRDKRVRVQMPKVHLNRSLFHSLGNDQDAEKIVSLVLHEFCDSPNQWFLRPKWELALKAKIAKAVGCHPSDVVLCLD